MSTSDSLWLVFVLAAVSLGTLALVVVGGYYLLRQFAGMLNNRQAAWESIAEKIGAKVDRNTAGIYKPLMGERNGTNFVVTFYSVPSGKHSNDDHVQVESKFSSPLPFTFEINKPEHAFKKAAIFIERHLANDGAKTFESEFDVVSSNRASLAKLLNAYISDGETTSLMVDLLGAGNKVTRLQLNQESVAVGLKAEFGDAEAVGDAVDTALYLVERIDRARKAAAL